MKVLDFAMAMNRRGQEFYRDLAKRAGSEANGRVFVRMAEEEERMLEEYRRMEKENHLRQIESPVLDDLIDPFRTHGRQNYSGSELSAYRLALEMEGEVCRMLEDAAEREENASAGAALRRVAAVECGELREIEQLYYFVNAPNEFLAWREFSNLDEFHNFGRYEDNRGCRHTK